MEMRIEDRMEASAARTRHKTESIHREYPMHRCREGGDPRISQTDQNAMSRIIFTILTRRHCLGHFDDLARDMSQRVEPIGLAFDDEPCALFDGVVAW